MTWTAPNVDRVDEPFVGDERAMLDGFLDLQRDTLLFKCAGLAGAQLAAQAVPPSNLSLLGLVRHLTETERSWFRRRFGGQSVESQYWQPDRPDAAFEDVDPDNAEQDLAALLAERELARAAVADLPLDAVFVSERWGKLSLRWGYYHLIEEYARHNGHADLLRQRIDGMIGA
jgi:hypothetical protein